MTTGGLIVKVCGITRIEDARVAEAAGADWIGFVFAKSPRRVDPADAAAIANNVNLRTVGVFVNESPDVINRITGLVGLDYVQLHGNEDQAMCDAIGSPVIKAIRVRTRADIDRANVPAAYRYLLDTRTDDAIGGTGQTFDWSLARDFDRPYLLAGGLSAANVAEAIGAVRPWGVDASSGLESAPGIKDPEKVMKFVTAAREASHAA